MNEQKKKKDLLFINGYIYLPGENAIKRTFYLFDLMIERGLDVDFLTSDFNHYTKKKRDIACFAKNYPQYKDRIFFLELKQYDRNISFKRFFNGIGFEKRAIKWFKKYGQNYKKVYVSLPSSTLVNGIKKHCEKNDVELIVDVNDLFPESTRLIFKNELLYKLFTFPFTHQERLSFSKADRIIAVSDEYREYAKKYNKKADSKTVYIGAMLERFDLGVKEFKSSVIKPNGEIWATYIGTLGSSYDLETIMFSVDALRKVHHLNIRFKVLGQGPSEKHLRLIAQEERLDGTDFLGFLPYERMAAFLSCSDFCMNSLKTKASQSVINKISDYLAAGKAVFNCGSSIESSMLISKYRCGYNYISENVDSLTSTFLTAIQNPDDLITFGHNSRELAENLFDRRKTHLELIDYLFKGENNGNC